MLVIYCSATRGIFTQSVPTKGLDLDGYIVEKIRDDVPWLGHPKVIITSDNEPALLHVVNTALAALEAKGVASNTEGSVPFDPQTNGAAENAVRLFRGSLRTNLLSFERRLQARIPVNRPILAWLAICAASVRTMRVGGPDGLTAHQRARGSKASILLIPVGQACRHKAHSKAGGIGSAMTRWNNGIFIGVERRTGQYIVYDQQLQAIHTHEPLLDCPNL